MPGKKTAVSIARYVAWPPAALVARSVRSPGEGRAQTRKMVCLSLVSAPRGVAPLSNLGIEWCPSSLVPPWLNRRSNDETSRASDGRRRGAPFWLRRPWPAGPRGSSRWPCACAGPSPGRGPRCWGRSSTWLWSVRSGWGWNGDCRPWSKKGRALERPSTLPLQDRGG